MRKVVFFIHMSLDGFAAGPNGEMDWIVYDEDMQKYAHSFHATTDAAIYGRVTYEMMASYWPTVLSNPSSDPGDRSHAEWLEDATKIVVSRTLDSTDWKGTVVIGENMADEIQKLKQQPGKDMWLLGSPTLARSFAQHGLIDDYRVSVNPVILGKGLPVFAGLEQRAPLTLVDSQRFDAGTVVMRYVPA